MKKLSVKQRENLDKLQIAKPIATSPQYEGDRELETSSIEVSLRAQLKYTEDKLEDLREICRSIFYRSEAQINQEIQQHLSNINSQPYATLIQDYINRTYTYSFFENEPDADFKFRLAEAILTSTRAKLKGYSNSLLQAIVNNDSGVRPIMASWIDD